MKNQGTLLSNVKFPKAENIVKVFKPLNMFLNFPTWIFLWTIYANCPAYNSLTNLCHMAKVRDFSVFFFFVILGSFINGFVYCYTPQSQYHNFVNTYVFYQILLLLKRIRYKYHSKIVFQHFVSLHTKIRLVLNWLTS